MNALNLQVLLLLSAAFFLGAAIACGLRKLFAPAEDETNVGEFAPAAAVPRAVEPLPEIAAQRAKAASDAANRFEQALSAEQQRAAPAPAQAPAPRPVPVAPPVVAAPPAPKPVPAPPPVAPAPIPVAAKPAAPPPVAPPPSAPPAPAPAAAATVAAAAAALAAASQASAKPAPAPQPAPAAAAKPVPAPAAPAISAPDDLTRIRGIDRDIAARLNTLGVTRYAQIASWMRSDITKVNETIGFRRRVEQENWIEQAQILAAGGQTAFARSGFRVAPVPPPPVVPAQLKPVTAPAAATPAPAPAPAPSPAPAAPSVAAQTATVVAAAAAAAAAVAAPKAPPLPPAAQPVRPAAGPARDQFQRISGVSAEIEKLLNVQGVTRYGQIASWSAADVERFDRLLGSTGRIQRENWIEQAQFLARGGDTSASRDFDRRATPPSAAAAPAPAAALATPPAAAPASPPPEPAKPAEEVAVPSAAMAAGAAAAAAAAAMRAAAAAATPPAADAAMRPAKLTDALRDQLPPAAPRTQDLGALRSVKSEAFQSRPTDAATAAAAAAAAAAGSARVVRASDIDDLKRIRGIGVLIEKRLNAAGVTTYEQIASWTNNDIARFSHLLDFKGRIERENWVEQARILASGGYTEFSRRVDRGEVETSRPKT